MTTEYEPLDFAEMQSEYNRVSAEPNKNQQQDYLNNFVKLPERDGFVVLRILPRRKGQKPYCVTRTHTLINPYQKDEYGKPKTKAYHCPRTLVQTDKGPRWQGDCIVCKYYGDLWQKSESLSGKSQEDLQDQARAIKPVERYYYNVVVRSEKNKTGDIEKNVVRIYSCGKTVHQKIVRAAVGDELAGEKPLGDITHPVNGRDFRVVKKVSKGSNGSEYPSYDNSKFEDPSPLGNPDEVKTWIENMPDLQSLRVLKTDEELRQALRVHLGMVKDLGKPQDHDLDEFRSGGSTQSSISVNTDEPVREDLVTSSLVSSETSTNNDENELLADEQFMNELSGM